MCPLPATLLDNIRHFYQMHGGSERLPARGHTAGKYGAVGVRNLCVYHDSDPGTVSESTWLVSS